MQNLSSIHEHMEIIGADGVHVGTVERVEAGRIKLTKEDSGEGGHEGHHHYIPASFVAEIEGDKVRLSANGDVAVMEDGETWLLRPYDPFEAAEAAGSTADRVATPMPGKIIQVLVKPGESVKKGQPLAVLEAMKMEHTLSAPSDAEVSTVEVQLGDQVPDGTVVVRFKQEIQKAA